MPTLKNAATARRPTGRSYGEDEGDVATHVAEVIYHGDKMILPIGLSIPDAIDLLQRRQEYLEEAVHFTEKYDVFPYDGAMALDWVLTEKFGWSAATATPGFFGPTPPTLINVRTGPKVTDTKRISWGSFSLPGVDGLLTLGVAVEEGRYRFTMGANVKRKDEATLQQIFLLVRQRLETDSIYKGKAIKIKFRDGDGDPIAMPEPEFIDTDRINPAQLIYSKDVHNAIETNLFTPIMRVKDCIANGIPVKRGVMLGGTFGTGKTLAATVAAHHAVNAGVTYVYIPNASELAEAIEFAKQYQSPACVIFCEDIDRVMSGDRDAEMDEILNLIDGIDTKRSNIIVVLTTNELDKVEPAMLRPGRLDAVIDVTPPDAEAVGRLLRHYGGESILPNTNLQGASEQLAGSIPAIVAEVVNRAKLAQLRQQEPGTVLEHLSEQALLEAAITMRAQTKLLNDRIGVKPDGLRLEDLMGDVVGAQLAGLTDQMTELATGLRQVKARVGA